MVSLQEMESLTSVLKRQCWKIFIFFVNNRLGCVLYAGVQVYLLGFAIRTTCQRELPTCSFLVVCGMTRPHFRPDQTLQDCKVRLQNCLPTGEMNTEICSVSGERSSSKS